MACAIIGCMRGSSRLSFVIRFAMTLLRLFIVLSLALLTMQGAFAHEHAMQPANAGHMMQPAASEVAMRSAASHCEGLTASNEPCRHDYSFCCATRVWCPLCGAIRHIPFRTSRT
jgi:hypothetical protein